MDTATAQRLFDALPATLRGIAESGLGELFDPTINALGDLETLLVRSTVAAYPAMSEADCRRMFAAALQDAVRKHSDFTVYVESMLIIGLGVVPYAYGITSDEFVEILYCAAKHGDFMQAARRRSILLATDSAGVLQ